VIVWGGRHECLYGEGEGDMSDCSEGEMSGEVGISDCGGG
jgi:hypothetical protein